MTTTNVRNLTRVAFAYVLLEAARFGYAIGWDAYTILSGLAS